MQASATRRAGPRISCVLLAAAWAACAIVGPAAAQDAEAAKRAPTPVVVVVFEGLPRASLLAPGGGIDAEWYPALAAFGAGATRFTAATTVATRPGDALAALVTGRLPDARRLRPIFEDHPDGLFSMLGDAYEMNVVESESALLDDGRGRAVHERRLQRMGDDRSDDLNEHGTFRRFVRRVGPTAERAARAGRGSLHFVHVRLPRAPWHLSAEGTSYRPYRMYGLFAGKWGEQPWWPEEAWRRHLMQVRHVDTLVGELIQALRAAGIHDDALVVVTAVYGAGFWPGESHRSLEPNRHPEDVLHVPLLVKRPQQTKGAVATRPVQTVDVLPTIAALLGRDPDHAVDGCSVFDEACAALGERRVMQSDGVGGRTLLALPVDLTERSATLGRRVEQIGSGATPDRVYAFGPHASLVGRRVESLEWSEAVAGSAVPDRQWVRSGTGARGPRVVWRIELDEEPAGVPQIAVVREGKVETVVPAPLTRRGQRIAAAMVPERPDLAQDAGIAVHLVESGASGDGSARLRPLTIRPSGSPAKKKAEKAKKPRRPPPAD